jgi:hypothetical protein
MENGKVINLSFTLAGANYPTLVWSLFVNPPVKKFPPVTIILPYNSFLMSTSHWLILSCTRLWRPFDSESGELLKNGLFTLVLSSLRTLRSGS